MGRKNDWRERTRKRRKKWEVVVVKPKKGITHGERVSTPPLPFSQRYCNHKLDKQFSTFLDIFKKLYINITFIDVFQQLPLCIKFMKEIISKKRKFGDCQTISITKDCSAIINQRLPLKLKDPNIFCITYTIREYQFGKALCDLRARINLMRFSVFKKLGLGQSNPTSITLLMDGRSMNGPKRVIE